MQIQLIHPPVYVNPKAWTALRPSPPLGLAYVAAALERAGHQVSIVDALAEAPDQTEREGRVLRLGLSAEEIVARIAPETRAVGLTNMWSFCWPVVRELIQRLKQERPNLTVVCGGEHFNGLPEFSMDEAPIDYIVRGEGEATAVELFAALERQLETGEAFDPGTIAGLVWRDGDRVVVNPARERIRDVDGIAPPAWHLFSLETYNTHDMNNGIRYGYTVPILATRGCPYSCTYCSSPRMWTTRWYARDPALLVDEIEHYVETYGARNFPMQDLTTIVKRDWILRFCREIIRRGLDIRWQLPSGTRCEVIDDEVAPLLYQAGCRALAYAPESGSDETRKRIRKRMKKESLLAAVDASAATPLTLTCFIVLGFPHDREENVRENLAFVRELARRGVDDIACGFFFPIPATADYDYLMERGRISLKDGSLMAPIFVHDRFLTQDRNYSDHISAWRLTLYRWLVLLNFYPLALLTHPRRVLRILRNLVRGREESRLESALQIYLRHRLGRLRRWVRDAAPAR